ncbi:hypothetical protein OHA40_10490 [Nocardia sp. NBC_00508]|uniref:hypothetical protein n=1 Tax=Nocardia sp. NBC_00508 TaxID=2975992 RepID=UPI002E803FAD|nr:hypothetical protein [Nocardia sp. NBC_00508]WUD68493.1 hypothetical protein OHA40_10490 [Nocardia sp. NBC_00508]
MGEEVAGDTGGYGVDRMPRQLRLEVFRRDIGREPHIRTLGFLIVHALPTAPRPGA